MKHFVGAILMVAGLNGCIGNSHKDTITSNSQDLIETIKDINELNDKMTILICEEMLFLRDLDEQTAADLINNYRGDMLCLDNVTMISPEVAAILASFEGKRLSLAGLQYVDRDLAVQLAKYRGYIATPERVKEQIRLVRDIREI